MIRRLVVLITFICFTGCDDGDILDIELDFDGDLELCDDNVSTFLIYDTRQDPNESLTFAFPRNDQSERFFTTATPEGMPVELTINGSSIRLNYRSYNRAVVSGELCEVIPPANLNILEDYETESGKVFVTVVAVDDDEDGIPSIDEDLNGNGDLEDDDFDGDDIPNYKDKDDDNDNVRTIEEIDDLNEDGDDNPLTNPLDTDGDTIPDFLDTDDDGDGTLTRLEDQDCDTNPTNDRVVNPDGSLGLPFFLEPNENADYMCTEFITNTFKRTILTSFFVQNVNLGPINATEFDLGTYNNSFEIDSESEND